MQCYSLPQMARLASVSGVTSLSAPTHLSAADLGPTGAAPRTFTLRPHWQGPAEGLAVTSADASAPVYISYEWPAGPNAALDVVDRLEGGGWLLRKDGIVLN